MEAARGRLRRRAAKLRSESAVSQETLQETRESLYILQSLLRGERPLTQTRHSPSPSDLQSEDGLSQYNGSGEILSALDSLDDMVTVLQFDARDVPAWRDSLEVILRSVTASCPPSLCEVARLHLQEVVQLRTSGATGHVLNSALERMLRTTRRLRSHVTNTHNTSPLREAIRGEKIKNEGKFPFRILIPFPLPF